MNNRKERVNNYQQLSQFLCNEMFVGWLPGWQDAELIRNLFNECYKMARTYWLCFGFQTDYI